jgi:N-acetylglucosamine-6-phosphate deacetylase
MTAEIWLCPDALFDGEALRPGMALGVAQGRTTALRPRAELPGGARIRSTTGTLVPGYLDLQVNGGGDVLLNTSPTAEGIAAIAAAHRRFGTVGIMATLISDAPEVLERAVEAALAARGQPGFLGLHIEGPHLSIARRGTHRAAFIRPMDDVTLAHVTRLRRAGVPVMITVAPEAVTPGQVSALAATGAVVSIGHSDASAEAVRALLAAGAGCFTHLFNAMSPMLNRAPGVTGACINSTAYSGIICDGIHVADEMVGLAIRARPVADRMFLVSDAMPTVGGSDHFRLYGAEIRLVNGMLVNAEGSLAGAHVTMAQSLARLIRVVGVDPAQALRMTSTVPAAVIGRPDLSRVEGRALDDLLSLDDAWQVTGTAAGLADGLAA